MISRSKLRLGLPTFVLFLLIFSLFLVACERPLDGDNPEADVTTTTVDDSDQNGGAEAEPTTPAATAVAPEPTEPAAEDGSALPSDDSESAITPDESVTEEVTDAAEEAVEEVEDAAEEVTDEAADTNAESSDEGDTSSTDSAEGDSEVGGGVAEPTATPEATAAETDASEAAADDAESATSDETGEADTGAAEQVHVVQPGENLYRIGLKYGVSWVVLADYNNLPNANSIYVGQSLNIPSGSGSDGDEGDGGGEGDASDTPTTYTVQPGDTLYEIGTAFDVDWQLIAKENNVVNPYRLYVGLVLTIPTGTTPPPATDITHVVRAGETLFSISLHYGVAWRNIAEANEIAPPYVIYPGQSLTIPGAG